MDLVNYHIVSCNYIIILGKNYLWTCRYKNIKPFILFKRILLDKYETEKQNEYVQQKKETI